MSDRERWIVYPLLFLALGASLRDKLAKQTRAKQIVCEQLYVVDSEGRPLATLAGNELHLDLAGKSEGYLTAGLIDAESLFQRRKPVVTAGVNQGLSLPQLLRMLPQLQLPQMQPRTPTPRPTPPTLPEAEAESPPPRIEAAPSEPAGA